MNNHVHITFLETAINYMNWNKEKIFLLARSKGTPKTPDKITGPSGYGAAHPSLKRSLAEALQSDETRSNKRLKTENTKGEYFNVVYSFKLLFWLHLNDCSFLSRHWSFFSRKTDLLQKNHPWVPWKLGRLNVQQKGRDKMKFLRRTRQWFGEQVKHFVCKTVCLDVNV